MNRKKISSLKLKERKLRAKRLLLERADLLVREVAKQLAISDYQKIYSPGTMSQLAFARRHVYIILRENLHTFKEIGELFEKDHSTVIRSMREGSVDEELLEHLRKLDAKYNEEKFFND